MMRRRTRRFEDSEEAGQAFRQEAGHRFRFDVATWYLFPRIDVRMFCLERLVKRALIWISGLRVV